MAKKYRRILVLMAISQVLLVLFVLYWLRSQYFDEKKLLEQRLTTMYIDTQDEIIDTILYKNYVQPAMSADKRMVIREAEKRGSRNEHVITTISGDTVIDKNSAGKKEGIIDVRIITDRSAGTAKPDSDILKKSSENLLIRSVRLVIAHSSDTGHFKKQAFDSLVICGDSETFRQHFDQKMKLSGLKLGIHMEDPRDSLSPGKKHSLIFIRPHTQFKLPPVEINSYSWYLIGTIGPQVAFGLALVLITALAFFLSYRSIRSQHILNGAREEFISNITHELRTPVATLGVAIESLGRYNMASEPQKAAEYLRLASLETKRLEELINRVLDQTLLESGSASPELAGVNITTLLNETADLMRHKLTGGGKIETITGDIEIMVKGDPLFLKGALINLVDNAIRYCDKIPEIVIESKVVEGAAEISIRDNGPGIPEEYQNRIFDKFFRLPSGNVHNVKGYGLGLSFVKLVMKLHGGSVVMKNIENGCVFTLRMPLGK
ncbi:MAG TPA: HAMP domain-containing sensor histidine kinase [Bacteroidales bacterium]|nr:HAMP domain-containing sensor histidine kinase [Bacteroidales bacterium]